MNNDPSIAAYLIIQDGPQAGKRVEICKDCTTIGRSRTCDLFLEDITVHRRQASIIFSEQDEGYILRDDHGSGDSQVNGQPVKSILLGDGDRLRFGLTNIIFYAQEPTRSFQLPSSRGRESHKVKLSDPNASAIASLDLGSANGTGSTRTIELRPELTIGRSRDCALFLEDLAVSRLHATIHQLPDGSYELEDHHSATGTFINGRAITRHQLREGDVVQIGKHTFTFRNTRS